jgi:hypothetical protein
MFGVSRNSQRLRGFQWAAPILNAMFDGKTPQQRRATGASLCPWLPLMDALTFVEAGSTQAIPRSIPMAAAVARHGDLDALEGIIAREDFFLPVPFSEERVFRADHSEVSLAMGCAIEAISMGRLDMLDALARAGRERHQTWSEQPDEQGRSWERRAERALEIDRLDIQDVERLIRALAFAPALNVQTRLDAVAWISKKAVDVEGMPKKNRIKTRLPHIWLAAAVASGQAASVQAAQALGAQFNRGHLVSIAGHGLFDLAAQLAPAVVDGATLEHSQRSGEEAPSVCAAMAHGLIHLLEPVARAISEEESSVGSRESSWASFCDHRQELHQGALQALRGMFDTPFDALKPDALDAARDRLASAARALASACPTGQQPLDPAQVDELRPEAPSTCEELMFLARLESARLPRSLALAKPAEGDRFARALLDQYDKTLKAAQPRGQAGSRADQVSKIHAKRAHGLERAIEFLLDAAPHALSAEAFESLNQKLSATPGLLERIEAWALHRSAGAPNAPARAALKL